MNKAVEKLMNRNVIYFIMLIFLFGGVVGFIYEVLFYRIDMGYFMKRGTTMGPWIPIYGFGSVFILLTTEKVKSRPLAGICDRVHTFPLRRRTASLGL